MGRWKDSMMAMFTAYFDASGAPDQGAALSVAGFVAKAEQWIEFERNWKEALKAYGVTDLHMKDFGPGAGQYASWKDDKEKRLLFMERLVSIVKTRVRHSFVNSVMLADYRKVDELYTLSEMNKPFALAGSACIEKVRRWARKWNIDESQIAYMFEDGDKDRGDLIRCAERDHGVCVKLMKKSENVAFQAADLLAYEHRLANKRIYEAGVGTLGLTDLRGSLQALNDIPHGNDGEDWGVYDLESLTTQCVTNKYPLRSSFSADGPSG